MFQSLRLAVILSFIICSANQLPSNLFNDYSNQYLAFSGYSTILDSANYPRRSLSFSCDRISDSLALVALFNSTNGSSWIEPWDLQLPMNFWDGVSLSSEGCVENLDLSDKQLSGHIPPELGNLSNMQELYLQRNNLFGPIPAEMGNLTNLVRLFLFDNKLSSIPPELGNLSSLTTLYLWNNQLSGNIPGELGSLSNLVYLYLDNNQLFGSIPSQLGNLQKLAVLFLNDNQLSGPIPPELGNLAALGNLDLSGNELSGNIPPEFGNLSNLISLLLSNNELSGNIPLELENLSMLHELNLSSNQLSGSIPRQLGNLSNLVRLYLSQNNLSGSIPSELGNFPKLTDLFIHSNQIEGELPSNLGNLSNLLHLNLSSNQITGNIPPELGNLHSLYILDLSSNQITGNIPSELGNLIMLYNLFLSSNMLTGNIPPEFTNFLQIDSLQLNNNMLVGCFPPTFIVFCSIDHYNFSNNPGLPWNGDFSRFCNGEDQIGVPCNDENLETENDAIHGDCHCYGCIPYLINIDTILCPGQTIEVNGTIYSETIMSNFAGTSISGCDSIIQLNITILQDAQFYFEIDTTLCFGESIMVNNIEYTETGVYNIFIPEGAQSGCDSIILLDLLISTVESVTQFVDTFICTGELLIVGGNQYDEAGQYSITLPGASILGCDSIVELNIQNFSLENADAGPDQYLCSGEVVTLSGYLPVMSTGHWESDSPAVTFDNPNSPITNVNGLSYGLNIISWNVFSLECDESSSSSAEIFIQNPPSSIDDQYTIPFNTGNYIFNPLNNDELFAIENWDLNILNYSYGGEIFQENDSILIFEKNSLFFGYFSVQYEICDVLCPDQCDVSEIIINVLPPDNLAELIPSGITPNDDGINDVFIIPPIDFNPQLYSNSELIILNRWGSVVYKEKPYHNNWGGTNMQGDYLPQSTYYYIWTPGPGEKDITGIVTILK